MRRTRERGARERVGYFSRTAEPKIGGASNVLAELSKNSKSACQ